MQDTHAPVPATAPQRRWWVAYRIQEWAVILIVVPTVAGWLGDLWWVFDLCNHFRAQYVLVLLILAVTTIMTRQWAAAAFVAIALTANAMIIAPLFSPGVDDVVLSSDRPPLHMVAFNVHTANRRVDEVGQFLADTGADILLLQEIDVRWETALRHALGGYDVAFASPRDDNFGIALFIRRSGGDDPGAAALAVDTVREIDVSDGVAQVPAVELIGRWRGRPFALLGLHTLPPVRASIARARDAQLAGAAAWAARHRATGTAVIIAGDLNATPWCAPFRRLIADARLDNSIEGRGLNGSWPASMPALLRIPIDHFLYSDDFRALRRTTGSDGFGSDHVPISAWLDWRFDEANDQAPATGEQP